MPKPPHQSPRREHADFSSAFASSVCVGTSCAVTILARPVSHREGLKREDAEGSSPDSQVIPEASCSHNSGGRTSHRYRS
jgi:hypothetical protein